MKSEFYRNNTIFSRSKVDRSVRDYQMNSVQKYKEVEEELQKAKAINERHNTNIAGHEKTARENK